MPQISSQSCPHRSRPTIAQPLFGSFLVFPSALNITVSSVWKQFLHTRGLCSSPTPLLVAFYYGFNPVILSSISHWRSPLLLHPFPRGSSPSIPPFLTLAILCCFVAESWFSLFYPISSTGYLEWGLFAVIEHMTLIRNDLPSNSSHPSIKAPPET